MSGSADDHRDTGHASVIRHAHEADQAGDPMHGDARAASRASLPSDDAAVLARLGVAPERILAVEPLAGGISGAAVRRLLLSQPVAPGAAAYLAQRVYKRIGPEAGWLGVASRDTAPRELRLHRSRLLADLPPGLTTGVVAAAEPAPGVESRIGGVLLADERGHLLRDPLRSPPGRMPRTVVALVRRIARLHARYWNDPRLSDPALGLVSDRDALMLTSPAAIEARIATGDPTPYLALARAGWERFFALADSTDAALLRGVLADPAPVLAAVERLPRTLVHGDLWGPNLGWLSPGRRAPRYGSRLLLLDWALATAGPCTYDPLWLCGTWHALEPVRVLAAYRAALSRSLAARDIRLPAPLWCALADAGYLRTALTCGEALGRTAAEAPAGAARAQAEVRVRWWARRAATGARRLMERG